MMKFDQHFLVNREILLEIINISNIKKNETILEIGAGTGNLTKLLLKKANKVYSIEIDSELCEKLKGIKDRNFKLFCKNALKIKFPKFDKLVANIPYSISEPLIQKLIHHDDFEIAVIMVSEKFYQKLISGNTKLSYIARHFFEIEKRFEITPSAFSPPPKVSSVVITLKPMKFHTTKDFIIGAFLKQKDKKARNALREAIIMTGESSGKKIIRRDAKKLSEGIKTEKKVSNLSLRELSRIEKIVSSLNF